jgi:hypothetical protein
MVDQAEIHMAVDGKESISEVEEISLQIQEVINSKFPSIERVLVVTHAYSKIDTNITASRRNLLRNIKLKKPSMYANKNNNSGQK